MFTRCALPVLRRGFARGCGAKRSKKGDDKAPTPRVARAVPTSPLARALELGGLAVGLGASVLGARLRGDAGNGYAGPAVLRSDRNAELLVETVCRMRGAALKLAQMLSMQDENLLPPQWQRVFERVRDAATVMPGAHVVAVMADALGPDWRDQFAIFDEDAPVAAASIGQVHRAVLAGGGADVAVKVQYPGIGRSIVSDLSILERLLAGTGALPRGTYLNKIIAVTQTELLAETDYLNEAGHQTRFAGLVAADPALAGRLAVPAVLPGLTTPTVLTTEFARGVPVETVGREHGPGVAADVAGRVLGLTLTELFRWRYMQTDPNWSNYLYDAGTDRVVLLDFGACREFPAGFVDVYRDIVLAAAREDRQAVIDKSVEIGLLSGMESKIMTKAHADAVMILGEPFRQGTYDFGTDGATVTQRMKALVAVMLEHRIKAPPTEIYALHRKLAGAFLLCERLRARVPARDLLEAVAGPIGR